MSGSAEAQQREDPAQGAIQAIWLQHRTAVVERLDVLERAVTELMTGGLGDGLRSEAEREAHKIAGSVGTFGFTRASEHARELELALAEPESLVAERVPALAELVVALRSELEEAPPDASPARAQPAPVDVDGPLLLVVDDDRELAERLAAEARAVSMRPVTADSPEAAREAVARSRPDAVLLDLGFPEGAGDPMALLSSLSEEGIPVLVLTVSDAFTDRVEAARRGARGFLSKSEPPREVLSAVAGLLERLHAGDIRLLAVDDDPTILASLRALLTAEGISLTTLSDPARLWEALEQENPELLIFDVDMPEVNGIELCRVVRNDPRWGSLPIVFLTARRDPQTVQEVFSAGADDYLNKPIVGAELSMRIRNRLERIRLYRNLADFDALTGVANRRKSAESIEQLTRLAARQDQPLALAELDIDHFKRVNDRSGHAAGDAVLRRLGELLLRSFRGEDVVGRWGGEEFVVAMYGLGRDEGVQRLGDVLEAFRAEDFSSEGMTAPLTFSAGVAEYPQDGSDLQTLHRAADRALYLAKDVGRDRVLPAGWSRDHTPDGVDVAVVEDEDALADLLVHALETRGYVVRRFGDGAQAAAALSGERPELRPRLVLLDVDLPGLDGLSVLRRLAADGTLERSAVVMLTARSAESEVIKALDLGAADHVSKPFSVPVLMQKVRRALASS